MNLKQILPRDLSRKMRAKLAFIPDRTYISLYYFAATGRIPNLKKPVLFGEKQQWLKLHDQHPEYTELVDKLAVRKHIDACLGEGHCFPLLGNWKNFDDIDFSQLPDEFVLKCNHDSGSTKIIHNKQSLTEKDLQVLKAHFDYRLKQNYFYAGREYPYKNVQPCIIAEKVMRDKRNPDADIEDYKFFCFNGEPKLMFIASDRSTDCRFDFFDMDFKRLDITNIHPQSEKKIEKPKHFEELREVAAKLSKGMKFVRIDLYDINDHIYFGEYTFFHGGGFNLFYPLEWERKLGEWVKLN